MSIQVSIEILEATYELLRATDPFKRWKLPQADEISFSIIRNKSSRGEFYINKKSEPTICVNDKYHHTLDELLRTVAHEMCHLVDYRSGVRSDVHHGWTFNQMADRVCKFHSFDRGAF